MQSLGRGLSEFFEFRNPGFQNIHGNLRAYEEGDGLVDQGVSSNREKMNWAIVANFLENLKLVRRFGENDETFGSEDLPGEGTQEILESLLFNICREWNFTGGEVVFRMVVFGVVVTVYFEAVGMELASE